MYELFYVADKHQALERIVLGRYWMWSTNCHLDWEQRQYTIQVNSVTLTGPSAQELSTEIIQASCASSISVLNTPQTYIPKTKQTTDSLNGKKVNSGEEISSWKNRQGRGESLIWMPKQSNLHVRKSTSIPQSGPPKQRYPTHRFQETTLRWVPKRILQGQGYYAGAKQVWIPKKLQTPSAPTTINSVIQGFRKSVPHRSAPNPILKQRWVVRADYNKKKYKATEESPQQLFESSIQTPQAPPVTSLNLADKARAVPQFKPFAALTIREKATYVQALLLHTTPQLSRKGTLLHPIITLPRGITSSHPTLTVKSPVIGLQA